MTDGPFVPPAPQDGIVAGSTHYLAVRVYFEDTDAGGIVYHANYLKFMERARSDFARAAGIDQNAMMGAEDFIAFVVRRAEIDYLRPARLDDSLVVETRIDAIAGASMMMAQTIHRAGEPLVRAKIRIAFLDGAGRARRLPAPVRAAFESFLAPSVPAFESAP